MYEGVCYTEPFLKEVIFKVDFPSPLQAVKKGLPQKLTKAILGKFPISEPQKGHAQELQFSGANIQAKTSEIVRWAFHGESREKTLIISPEDFWYTNRSYKTYESMVEDIEDILDVFFDEIEDATAGRVGLRYINVIDIKKETDPLVWSKYINEGILGVIDFHEENQFLTRAFHILEYNFNGLAVKHQFGIANPDFPAVVRKKEFVIDIDAYSHGTFEFSDIKKFIGDAHGKIQDIFEKSITNETRKIMKSQNEQ